MKKTVLFATVGNTDLQVLLEKDGELCRGAVIEGQTRAFHTALLEGRVSYSVDWRDIPDVGKVGLNWSGSEFSVKESSVSVAKEPENPLVLVPAKLGEVIAKLKAEEATCKVVAAVIFNTNRAEPDRRDKDAMQRYEREPFGAGPILSKWIAKQFGLRAGETQGDIGPDVSGWVDLFDGQMLTKGAGRDSPVNREAVRRLDQRLTEAASWGEGLDACVSTGGGIPEVKDVLNACAGFRFQGRVFHLVSPQFRNGGFSLWQDPKDEPPAPSESFRVRAHAAGLILAGDFAGAYRAVELLENDASEKKWVKEIRKAANFIAGTLPPNTPVKPYLASVLAGDRPRCLLTGIRAEAALTIGLRRVAEAALWTSAFFDAALLDFIESKILHGSKVDEFTNMVAISPKITPHPDLSEKLRDYACLNLKKEDATRQAFYVNTGGRYNDVWLRVLKASHLQSFQKALDEYIDGRTPRFLRNAIMHKSLSPTTVGQVADVFQSAGLWQKNVGLGERFLGGRLARNVLKELGIDDPAALYRGLVNGLLNDVAGHEIR